MNKKLTLSVAIAALVAASGCSDSSSTADVSNTDVSNGDSNGGQGSVNATSAVSLAFSDAPLADISNVTIAVDKIVFNRSGDDIEVDTFTSEDLDIEDQDEFSINLLEVQGNDNKLVIDSVDLPVGEYQNLRLHINESASFVNEYARNENIDLKVPSGVLKLGGFEVSETNTQTFVVEFGLEQAMTYNPGPDRYILKPRGVRIVSLENASYIQGNLDYAALEGCTSEEETISSYAYLYEGHSLEASNLGDMFVREDEDSDDADEDSFDENVAADVIAPVVASAVNAETGDYFLSYIPSGDYTLAITCQTSQDDEILHDEFAIPSSQTELIELTLAAGTGYQCDFPLSDTDSENCTVIPEESTEESAEENEEENDEDEQEEE